MFDCVIESVTCGLTAVGKNPLLRQIFLGRAVDGNPILLHYQER